MYLLVNGIESNNDKGKNLAGAVGEIVDVQKSQFEQIRSDDR